MLAHDEKLSYGNTGMLGATMNPMMELYKLGTSKHTKEKELQHIRKVEGGMNGLPLMELYQKKASEMAIHDELHEKPHMTTAQLW